MNQNQETSIYDYLGMPYMPASDVGTRLYTEVPDSMATETQNAVFNVQEAVGGDVDNYVRERLGYPTMKALKDALSAEQIDAVAMAVYNIEARRQGMIIGDQTGIGKGRVAAAIIRYGVHQGNQPVFITEKPNLFSDLYRDLVAIGSDNLVPFIVNAKDSKSVIKDQDGTVVHEPLTPSEQETIFKSKRVPEKFHFVMATYSQFNSILKKPTKPEFLLAMAKDNVIVLDESHNASGSSNTGVFLRDVLSEAKGVTFLSATFAKRPDNMPLYAMKTCIRDCAMDDESLIFAITKGGVALQEIVSSQLVKHGQMLRRERSYEGIEVNYLTLTQYESEHRAAADRVTAIIRRIIAFQENFIKHTVEELDKESAVKGEELQSRKGTDKAGVDNQPYFSRVFMVINQLLFAIKAEAVADRAIQRLREGKKPVIAFSSTMGSFLDEVAEINVGEDFIDADFKSVLYRGLRSVMKITKIDATGNRAGEYIEVASLSESAQAEYYAIQKEIGNMQTGLCISPIDVLIKRIEDAGFSVAEVTGRKLALELVGGKKGTRDPNLNGYTLSGFEAGVTEGEVASAETKKLNKEFERSYGPKKAIPARIMSRKRTPTNDAFRKFNNNEVDVLMINQSGSTGASAHAITTNSVGVGQVKQRVMIVLQAELDINTEVQKRGRINRTGQIIKPIYDYMATAIPAEGRLMMMLQKKLKSLDANTASNQKQSKDVLDFPDFLNKIGDRLVYEYLAENKTLALKLGDPLHQYTGKEEEKGNDRDSDDEDGTPYRNAASKVTGRVAVLSTEEQSRFYNEITNAYNDEVTYLKEAGEYDLEVEVMDLKAELVSKKTCVVGKGVNSPFGGDSVLEKVKVNSQRKPMTAAEIQGVINERTQGQDPAAMAEAIVQKVKDHYEQEGIRIRTEIAESNDQKLQEQMKGKKFQGLVLQMGREAAEKEFRKDFDEVTESEQKRASRVLEVKVNQIVRFLTFFTIGKFLYKPVMTEVGTSKVGAVVLDVMIDTRRSNPYLPSAMKVKIAICNGQRSLAIPLSKTVDLDGIISNSYNAQPTGSNGFFTVETLGEWWEQNSKEASSDRVTRYIVTGNLLQAFANYPGKLVSYTTQEGGENKGILMNESFGSATSYKPGGSNSSEVIRIPLSRATDFIRRLPGGHMLRCSNNVTFKRNLYGSSTDILVPGSFQVGGSIYTDQELMAMTREGTFTKISDKFRAAVTDDRLEAFVKALDEKKPGTVEIESYRLTAEDKERLETKIDDLTDQAWKRVTPPGEPAPDPQPFPEAETKALSLARARARAAAAALELEIELMEMEEDSLAGISNPENLISISRANAAAAASGLFPS